ncbi:hypothetical protein UF75_2003 [Desulfosporosinus sp. I2]|nr:hypothetical protein UF75_2003 [Desulfosporosinus sp. I2]
MIIIRFIWIRPCEEDLALAITYLRIVSHEYSLRKEYRFNQVQLGMTKYFQRYN